MKPGVKLAESIDSWVASLALELHVLFGLFLAKTCCSWTQWVRLEHWTPDLIMLPAFAKRDVPRGQGGQESSAL